MCWLDTKQAKIVRRRAQTDRESETERERGRRGFLKNASRHILACVSQNFSASTHVKHQKMRLGSYSNIMNVSQFNSPPFLFFEVLQEELGNWRSSNYSAISREFADNARFVFRSLEERRLHGNYIIDRLEGKETDSVGAHRTEQLRHFMTFPFFAC